jgi:hypothetical protein
MRKLLVPVVLIGSILLVQSPAYAWHRFYLLSLDSAGEKLVVSVKTNCEGNTLKITSPALATPITKKIPSQPSRSPRVSNYTFTRTVAGAAPRKATFTASCGRDSLCPTRIDADAECPRRLRRMVPKLLPKQLFDPSLSPSELPFNGVPTARWLTIGFGLLLAGGLLLALGRRREA